VHNPEAFVAVQQLPRGWKIVCEVELKGVKEKDSNCYFVAIHNWFSKDRFLSM